MGRARNPNRDEAKRKWIESKGTISIKELAAAYGVPEQRIRKWKSEDKWQLELQTLEKKRGGQKGNQNAAGHGAPKGNNNAKTHGAYSCIHLENLTAEEREYIESLTLDTETIMLREYQLLAAKERDLIRKIKEYERAENNALYIDRTIEVLMPKGKEQTESDQKKLEGMIVRRDNLTWEIEEQPRKSKTLNDKLDKLDKEIEVLKERIADKAEENESKGEFKISAKTVFRSSSFERIMKLEAEYNKLHGRLLKLVDSMRAKDADAARLELDERKHTLAKQRQSGEFNIDPDTGELDDMGAVEAEDMEI